MPLTVLVSMFDFSSELHSQFNHYNCLIFKIFCNVFIPSFSLMLKKWLNYHFEGKLIVSCIFLIDFILPQLLISYGCLLLSLFFRWFSSLINYQIWFFYRLRWHLCLSIIWSKRNFSLCWTSSICQLPEYLYVESWGTSKWLPYHPKE